MQRISSNNIFKYTTICLLSTLLFIALIAYNWLYIRILLHPFPINHINFSRSLKAINDDNWQLQQIREDLTNISRYSDQEVKNAYLELIKENPIKRYLYIKINNNNITYETLDYEYNRAVIVNALKKISKVKKLPDCSFIVVCGSTTIHRRFLLPNLN